MTSTSLQQVEVEVNQVQLSIHPAPFGAPDPVFTSTPALTCAPSPFVLIPTQARPHAFWHSCLHPSSIPP